MVLVLMLVIFLSTASATTFGNCVAAAAAQGGSSPHFVIDTSRNGGIVPAGQWCNPTTAGLGRIPSTSVTTNSLIDAYLWIKTPGQSDGTCNGGPAAGTYSASLAAGLIKNKGKQA